MAKKLTAPEPETRVVEGSPEGRELRQLVSKASLGKMMAGIADDAQGDGAERELTASQEPSRQLRAVGHARTAGSGERDW